MRKWKPGRGYRTAIRNTSWWRNDHDGTITAVAVVWPKMLPAFDGGEWQRPELWTVRLPLDADDPTRMSPWWKPWRHYFLAPGPIYMLNDKPHRVTWWDEDRPERKVLSRAPLPERLIACIRAEERKNGFDSLDGYYS
jgi:hypothetical protein